MSLRQGVALVTGGSRGMGKGIAAAVRFFASEEADYVTGQVLNVSGGWML